MSRNELVKAIRYLSRQVSLEELGRLTVPELQGYFIKLKARRLHVINERRRHKRVYAESAQGAHNLLWRVW